MSRKPVISSTVENTWHWTGQGGSPAFLPNLSEDSVQMAKAVMGIVRQPDPEEPVQVEIQESLPPFEPYSVSFVPIDVEYDLFQ